MKFFSAFILYYYYYYYNSLSMYAARRCSLHHQSVQYSFINNVAAQSQSNLPEDVDIASELLHNVNDVVENVRDELICG